MTGPTKKNHYNPCFWTAHWNPRYFEAVQKGLQRPNARHQTVHVLNVKSSKLYEQVVENVHCDKGVGIAEVTLEMADEFCRRYNPQKLESFRRSFKPGDFPVTIDFESVFEGLERLLPYTVLLEVIKNNCITSAVEKAQLAHFVIYQRSRSHAVMNVVLECAEKMGVAKLEPLLNLKQLLTDQHFLMNQVQSMVLSRWTIYRLDRDTFPLSDSAVSLKAANILVTLSPRLLVEINLRDRGVELIHRNRIEPHKLAEFRRRTIGSAFREIIFSDPAVLAEWRDDAHFRERAETIRTMKDYQAVVRTMTDLVAESSPGNPSRQQPSEIGRSPTKPFKALRESQTPTDLL
jgi:hypothetical protein